MQLLGNFNLFISDLIIGAEIDQQGETICFERIEIIKTITNWIKASNYDFATEENIKSIESISFLHEIKFDVLETFINDLISIYRKSYPYATEEDFINDNFIYYLEFLEVFISRQYIFTAPLTQDNYDFYKYFDKESRQYLYYVISNEKTIEHYKHYFKKVIEFIKGISFGNLNPNPIISTQNPDEEKENSFTAQQWATIFYFVSQSISTEDVIFSKAKLEDFIKLHNIKTSYNTIRNQYYKVQKMMIGEPDVGYYPIQKIEKLKPFLEQHHPETIAIFEKELKYLMDEHH